MWWNVSEMADCSDACHWLWNFTEPMTLCQRYLFQCIAFHRDGCKAASFTNCNFRMTDPKLIQGKNRERKVIWGFQNHFLFLSFGEYFGGRLIHGAWGPDYIEGRILFKWQENNLYLLNTSCSDYVIYSQANLST